MFSVENLKDFAVQERVRAQRGNQARREPVHLNGAREDHVPDLSRKSAKVHGVLGFHNRVFDSSNSFAVVKLGVMNTAIAKRRVEAQRMNGQTVINVTALNGTDVVQGGVEYFSIVRVPAL